MTQEQLPKEGSMKPAVYILSDRHDMPLYVGASRDSERRIVEHHAKSWWPRVTQVDVFPQDSWDVALYIERNLIKKISPEFNQQSTDLADAFMAKVNRGIFRDVVGANS